MSDLISRQEAIKAIEDLRDCYNGFSDTYDKACIIGVLEELPSVQPEPIKINIDHELTKEEYEKLRKDMADEPIVLLPSAQPEIIRCKDCKHYDGRPCGIVDWYNTANDFCSRAERRIDE